MYAIVAKTFKEAAAIAAALDLHLSEWEWEPVDPEL